MSEEDFNLFLANVLASVHGAGKVASLMRRPISEVYAAKLSAYYGQPVSPDFSLADVVKHVSEKLGRARTVHRQTLDGIEAIRELSKVGGSDPDPDPDPGPSRFRGALAGWGAGGAAGSVLGAGLGVAGGLAGLHYMRRAGDERLVEALADNPELSSRALAAGVGVAGGGAGALLGGTVSGATGLMAGASRPGGADPDAPWYAGHGAAGALLGGAAGALLGGAAGGVLSAPPREGVSALGRLGAGALIGAGLGAAGAVAADRATSWLAPRDAERQKTGGEALRYDAGRGAEAGGMVGGIGGGLAGAGLGAYTGSGWKSRLARGAAGGLAGAIGGGTVGMGVGAHTGAGASVIDPQGVTPEWQRHAVGGGALGAGLGVAGGAATGALLGRGWRDALTAGLGAGLAGGVAGGLGGAVVGGQRQAMDNVGL